MIPASLWLEHGRVAIQSAWFASFGAALGASLCALHAPRHRFWVRLARWAWALAMALLILMWLAGATLEMMQRGAAVSGLQMLVALGAFSLLVAGVLSLSREWFGANLSAPLHADKIALSPLILTLAGWWFGGMALTANPGWSLGAGDSTSGAKIPEAWALLLGGATLLGASRSVRSSEETIFRVHNPRIATWWLLGVILLLFWSSGAGAASTLTLAGSVFGGKVWRVRRDCPAWLRAPRLLRAMGLALLAAMPLLVAGETRAVWAAHIAPAWRESHQVVAWMVACAVIIGLLGGFRRALRREIAPRFFDRALLQGALAGFGAASWLMGPGGAVFWAFWPLCGVFFDLLADREPPRSSLAAELRARELAAVEPAP